MSFTCNAVQMYHALHTELLLNSYQEQRNSIRRSSVKEWLLLLSRMPKASGPIGPKAFAAFYRPKINSVELRKGWLSKNEMSTMGPKYKHPLNGFLNSNMEKPTAAAKIPGFWSALYGGVLTSNMEASSCRVKFLTLLHVQLRSHWRNGEEFFLLV